jgi:hypothetical protein
MVLYTDQILGIGTNSRSYLSHEHQTKIKKKFSFDDIASEKVEVIEIDFWTCFS